MEIRHDFPFECDLTRERELMVNKYLKRSAAARPPEAPRRCTISAARLSAESSRSPACDVFSAEAHRGWPGPSCETARACRSA